MVNSDKKKPDSENKISENKIDDKKVENKVEDKKVENVVKPEEKKEESLVGLALLALNKEIPVIVWNDEKDKGKYLFEIIDDKVLNAKNEFDNIFVHAYQIIQKGKSTKFDKVECNFQIRPSSLSTQIKKFKGLLKGQMIQIDFLGKKKYENPDTFQESESKAFVLSVFNPEINQFVTKPF